ncbi:MAG: pilus assembly protein PilM [Verrucomicrobiota bacterium]
MSSSKHLIINCGASRVTAALVSPLSGGLHIDKLVTESLDYDFTNDDDWLGAVHKSLLELSRTHKLSGKASIIIPGNQVLTKTIRIPHVEEAKRAQIIAFEAQQNIPYPLHEVVWDSQVVGDDGVETEVLFIACKSNTIDEFCATVGSAGFIPQIITAATILDYNAIQFAYPEMDDDVLLINIGARSTNLLFKNPDGFFVRNIQLGGNSLTQNIADSLGKTFAQAEQIKHKFFAGELEHTDEDSGAKLLQGSADGFIRRMSQEITRSIVNYRRQKGAAAPKRVLLSGRGALLNGLADQLSASQKMPVEFFDPLQNVTLDAGILSDPEELRLEISEIIGQASREQVADAAGVNLLPEEIQAEMAFSGKKPFLIAAAICLALAPWPAFLGYKQVGTATKDQSEAIQAEVMPLRSKQASIFDNTEHAQEIGQSIQLVEGLLNSKSNWIQFFAKLQESLTMAEDVWLDDLSVERSTPENGDPIYEIVLKGQMLVRESANSGAVNQAVLTARIKTLQSSFENSEFIVASKPPIISWRELNQGLNVLPFTINLVVDTAKTL